MRMRKNKWAEKELLSNERIIYDAQKFKGKWQSYFANENEIFIEIGCGKGNFITESAALNNCINYIAIERETRVIAFAAKKATQLLSSDSKNLVFVSADVKDLADYFRSGEIKRIYINFCDPWPNKKKWQKKRLTHVNFLKLYKSLLPETGEIFFKTDNMELFEFSINQFSEEGFKIRNVSLDLHNSKFENNIVTEYEEKFSKDGGKIYRLEAYLK